MVNRNTLTYSKDKEDITLSKNRHSKLDNMFMDDRKGLVKQDVHEISKAEITYRRDDKKGYKLTIKPYSRYLVKTKQKQSKHCRI